MANQYSAKINVNVNGTNLIISKLRSTKNNLSQAQYVAGRELGTFFVGEAYRIIRTLSPKSKGTLASSISFNTVKSQNGWQTKVFSDLDYAAVVEGGGPPETKKVNAALKDWFKRVTGRDTRLGSYVVVRSGANPNYDTATGMQFFSTPFKKNQKKIADVYQRRVQEALKKSGISYY